MAGYNTECTPVAITRTASPDFPYGEDLANSVTFACGRTTPVRYATRYAPAPNRCSCRKCRERSEQSEPSEDAPRWILNRGGRAVQIAYPQPQTETNG